VKSLFKKCTHPQKTGALNLTCFCCWVLCLLGSCHIVGAGGRVEHKGCGFHRAGGGSIGVWVWYDVRVRVWLQPNSGSGGQGGMQIVW